MSVHISAKIGEIAPIVLFPGDPLRAKYIAETFLQDAKCYNEVRGMLGFTGVYKGHEISVQGSGMGIPSAMIYANELYDFYGVEKIIRVGTAGAIHESLKIRDIVIASSACTTSSINKTRFLGYDFAPTATFDLVRKAYEAAKNIKGVNVVVGSILSSDQFYPHDEGLSEIYASYGVLAIEMEAAGLYTLAAKYNRQALGIMTISDHILTGEETTSQEREKTFSEMISIALEAAIMK